MSAASTTAPRRKAAYRPPTARKHDEDDLQRQIWEFLGFALPANAMAFHVPNGGMRSKRWAARMVGLGLVAGIPDIAVIWNGRAAFVELKAGRGVVSAAQKLTMQRLFYCGAHIAVCRRLEDVETFLRQIGVPLRAKAAA
jgi:hypothetical protein